MSESSSALLVLLYPVAIGIILVGLVWRMASGNKKFRFTFAGLGVKVELSADPHISQTERMDTHHE